MSDRRARILESAVGVFGRYGFKRCSMEDIAEAAGMSRPALYQHFKNKTEIFRAG
ncbi:MAG: helix-turn-helix domain-containing protein, partial [Pseudomonadota bacterium]